MAKKLKTEEIDALFADVSTALTGLLGAGAAPGEPPPRLSRRLGRQYGRETYATIPEVEGRALRDALARLPILSSTEKYTMWIGNAGWPVELEELVRWLVVASHDAGESTTAIQALKHLLLTNTAEGSECVAVWGLTVEAPTLLCAGRWLVPVGETSKTSIAGDRLDPTAQIVSATVLSEVLRPEAAAPRLHSEDEGPLVAALSVASMAPVIALATWTMGSPSTPLFRPPGGRGVPFTELRPAHWGRPVPLDAGPVSAFMSIWAAATPERRARVAVPMERLRRSMLRQSAVDAAIEVGIALESLLSDKHAKDPGIAYQIGMRCAWLLGTSPTTRAELLAFAGAVYSARCDAVHNGSVEREYKVKGRGAVPVQTLLAEGRGLIRTLLQHMLPMERDPDWRAVLLGAPIHLPASME